MDASLWSCSCFCPARYDLDRRGAGAGANHWLEIGTRFVFRTIGVVDAVVDLSRYRLEGHFLGDAGGGDSPRFLPQRSLVPARVVSVICAYIERVVHDDGPNPRRRAVRLAVLAKR